MNNNEKLHLYYLELEITRKCNLKCQHCFCGEAQDLTISEQVIYITLNQIQGSAIINITGGEPMLVPEKVEYIVDKIIENRVKVLGFGAVVNGTIQDERAISFINSLNKIASYINEHTMTDKHNKVGISISDDEFHQNNPNQAIEFYKRYASDLVYVENHNEVQKNRGKRNEIINSGRAKKNEIGKVCEIYKCPYSNKKCCRSSHRIEVEDGENYSIIKCPIQICANGNVGISNMISFEEEDKYAMGNILNESLISMIKKWQWKEPLLCKEVDMLANLESYKYIPELNYKSYDEDTKKCLELVKYYILLKREGMQEVHELFPDLDYDDVVKATNAMLNFKTQGNFSMALGTVFSEYKDYVFDAERENETWERLRQKQGMKGMSRLFKWLIN